MIAPDILQELKREQQQSISAATLTKSQLAIIYEQQWFHIWVPKLYGGLELSLAEGLKLLEELAYTDGGLAWTITLCSGANMFAGYIAPSIAEAMFSNPKTCFGGSGKVAGKAIWNGFTYLLSGNWSYATGAPHLTHFTLNAPIFDGEQPRLDANGLAVSASFFVPASQVNIIQDWATFGLECTASHSFSLEQVAVDANHCFYLLPSERKVDTPLFRVPFMTFAQLTLWVNYLGMYRRFLDLAVQCFKHQLCQSKDNVNAQKQLDALAISRTNLIEAQNMLEQKVSELWSQLQAKDNEIQPELLADIEKITKTWVKRMGVHVADLWPSLGIYAAQKNSELNIVFRNIFTATQHRLLHLQ